MAITKEARRKIFSLVQNSKDLLVKEVESQLEQYFGIHTNGSVIDVDLLTSKDADKIYTARILRQRLKYIQANQLSGDKSIKDAIRLLISEEAFTILNRFACLRMAEERNIIRESVRRSYNSEGFLVFDSITGQGQVTDIYTRYTWYLNAVFDELSIDLPALFDRFSPFALVFPSEQALIRLLDVLNNEEVTIYREEGLQPVNLWKEDETIGWIYQYYNSKEEIKEMREASDLPRNSRELAVRNQFFTPRYVVQFLTDNSLGRIWYEMTQGQTKLVQLCTYLIHRNGEVFLQKGQTKPENAESEIQYIDFRTIKDPREIKMLDPACGSMHFGLYSFDIFEQIYIEAWDKYPNLFSDLRDKYTRAEFIAQVPVLIIRHNIHGVDIDPRALQIAGLSLWLRAQKSFDKLGLQAKDRPSITRANLVLAEPMPGNERLLNSLLKPLDLPMQQLVRAIWDKMLLAGETGLLLKIEQEITSEIAKIAKEWAAFAKQVQAKLGDTTEQISKAKQAVKYSHPDYWQNFFDTAEQQVLDILKQLADEATNGEAYQTLLFAEDAQRGFAFIELCQQKYDVVLMNPPFGAPSKTTLSLLREYYPNGSDNLYIDFIERTYELITTDGIIGAITDRSFINKKNYEEFRINFLIGLNSLFAFIDLGEGVLDGANVDVAAHLYSKRELYNECIFLNLVGLKNKEIHLVNSLKNHSFKNFKLDLFKEYPSSAFVYDLPDSLVNTIKNGEILSKNTFEVFSGLKSADALFTNRLYWEVIDTKIGINKKWTFFQNGSPFAPYYYGVYLVVICDNGTWDTVMSHKSARITNIDLYYKDGLSYGKRTDFMYAYLMRKGCVFSMEGQAVFNSNRSIWLSLLVINSRPYQEIANRLAGQHKPAGYVNPISLEVNRYPNKEKEIQQICFELERLDSGNEISTSFICPLSMANIVQNKSFKEILSQVVEFKANINENANNFRFEYNDEICNILGINFNENKDRYVDYVNILYSHENSIATECKLLISYFIGLFFRRWDIDKINSEIIEFQNFNFFSEYSPFSPGRIIKGVTQLNNENDVCLEVTGNSNILTKFVEDIINKKLGNSNVSKDIISTICEILDSNSIDDYISKNNFFDFHYIQYSRNRREAPIYWPLSTASGRYTIWLYYPMLNDQTLYRIVNNYLKPKLKETESEISQLENNDNLDNKGVKQLNELQDYMLELLDFEKEILRIAQQPYFPNHDDGVLITASPLHKLFRHSKWRKSTEACWKSLEKGEYDWAHLAYSIWPARVKTKCKKDLSMAITHGLEDICDIKPKEKQAKKLIEPKEEKNKQSKLDM